MDGLPDNPRLEADHSVVVSFLAMLELIKRYLVLARQEQLVGEIEIEATQSLDENDELDLEFGE